MKSSRQGRSGFSMVEVCLALGLVVFCLVALVALLPVGLHAHKDSTDEAAAVNCMEQIAAALRSARSQDGNAEAYQAAGSYGSVLQWALGGGQQELELNNLDSSGFQSAADGGARYKARIELTPPKEKMQPGEAMITVAWPVQAQWDPVAGEWKNAQGSVSTWVIFLPQ